MVKLAGAKPIILQTTDRTEFKLTPDQMRAAITPRARLLIFNSPSNPTGSVYTPEEIKAIGDLCVEKGVLIMSDEIYEHLLYDGAKHKSVASFSQAHYDHTIVVHGCWLDESAAVSAETSTPPVVPSGPVGPAGPAGPGGPGGPIAPTACGKRPFAPSGTR